MSLNNSSLVTCRLIKLVVTKVKEQIKNQNKLYLTSLHLSIETAEIQSTSVNDHYCLNALIASKDSKLNDKNMS